MWQPIETAPKDGTPVLAWPCQVMSGGGEDGDWIDAAYVTRWIDYRPHDNTFGWQEASGERYAIFEPTHWMPLPELPK